MRIGIVAGEASGDILGAGLIQAIRQHHADVEFVGIAGPKMIEAGCLALYPAEKLSMMGYIEPLKHLPELLAIRRHIIRECIAQQVDAFVGIDAPDFNLTIERKLKQQGIKTVHYVSPSVWAWRQERVKKFPRTMDRMLTLFPFEADFYRKHHMPVTFVGHPLADMIPLQVDRTAARQHFGLSTDKPVLAILPGSRKEEVKRLADDFIQTAAECQRAIPDLQLIVPLASESTRERFRQRWQAIAPQLPFQIIDGQSREAMAAADTVLLASGTATLECLLLKRPMVIAYRLHPITNWLARRKYQAAYVTLPNLLANEEIVPERFQDDVNARVLAPLILETLNNPDKAQALQQRFDEIHRSMKCNASEQAAAAVLELIAND